MASVDFKKIKGAGDAKAMLRHADAKERERHEHSNRELDKSLSYLNVDCLDVGSYTDKCNRYDSRIRELDDTTNTNKRADRVTLFGLNIPVPEGMDYKTAAHFCQDVTELLCETYGRNNVIAADTHFDEIHEYMDFGEMRTSRAHLHAYVVPEINGQLNGKEFSSRKNMIQINKAIDELSRERYQMPFMTYETARKRTVEELKDKSLKEGLEELDRRREIAAQTAEKATQAIEKAEERVNSAKSEINALEGILERLREQGDLSKRKTFFRRVLLTPEEVKAVEAAVAEKTPLIEARSEAQAIIQEARHNAFYIEQQARDNVSNYSTLDMDNKILKQEIKLLRENIEQSRAQGIAINRDGKPLKSKHSREHELEHHRFGR